MGCQWEANSLYEEILVLATNKAVKDHAQVRLDESAGMNIESTPCVESP
jgi:hypothetical protein